jgi:hypothetical protein
VHGESGNLQVTAIQKIKGQTVDAGTPEEALANPREDWPWELMERRGGQNKP